MKELTADNTDDLLIELLDGAITENNIEAVRYILSRGGSPTAKCIVAPFTGLSLLEKSIIKGNIDIFKALVNTGEVCINVWHYNEIGSRYSLLCAAAHYGKIDIVTYLLDLGAKIDPDILYVDNSSFLDADGVFRTPLLASLANGKLGVYEYLIKRGANVSLSLIHLPKLENEWKKVQDHEMAETLLKSGASPNGKDEVGIPLFQRFIESDNIKVIYP